MFLPISPVEEDRQEKLALLFLKGITYHVLKSVL